MNIFDAIGNQQTVAILLWLLGAFLIGFITAWMYWRRKYKTLEAKAEDLQTQLTTTAKANTELGEKLGLSKADNNKLSVELDKLKARIKSVEIEKGDLHTEIYKLKDSLKLAEEAKSSYSTQLEGLDQTQKEITTLKGNLEAASTDARRANARVEVLKGKVEGLKEELAHAKANYNSLLEEAEDEVTARGIELPELSDEEKAAAATTKVASALGLKIPTSTAENKNDLTAIKGIGTFIESKLNGLGINSYQQISQFDEEMIDDVTTAMQYFPGRIERDNWVGQAKALLGTGDGELSNEAKAIAAKAALQTMLGTKISIAGEGEQDDLKAIDGIGPFIEAKLNELGIRTYQQISEFDTSVIEVITDAIAFFPGRIERDNWVNQAKTLLAV